MRILPVVKAYPVVDQISFSEAVCVAGIDMDEPHRWVRLFPLDYRGLERVQRFRKYEAITLEAHRSSKDSRPESYAPVLGSIEVGEHIGTDGGTWQRRMSFFDAIQDESMCEIQRRQKKDRKSLGVFRPKSIHDLVVSPAPPEFEASQRERYWSGDVEGGAEIYRRHLHNGSYSTLVELAQSLDDGTACLLCFERDHAVCHREVIVDSLRELRPRLVVDHL